MATITTPFGRGRFSASQFSAQVALAAAIDEARAGAASPGSNHAAAVNKWKLHRTLTMIRAELGLSDRSLAVLSALLSFHPETALTLPAGASEGSEAAERAGASCELVVFPSNRALSARAHAMPEKTLRRHLAALVEAGLIIRRDSPNGKRYARRAPASGSAASGSAASGHDAAALPAQAFGFDLTPLVARAPEFDAMAEAKERAMRAVQLTRERISLMRRDIAKLIGCGLDGGQPGPWEDWTCQLMELMTPLRRLGGEAELAALERRLAALRRDVTAHLLQGDETRKMTGNDGCSDRHLSNPKTDGPADLEPSSEKGGGSLELKSAAFEGRGRGSVGLDRSGAGMVGAQPTGQAAMAAEARRDEAGHDRGGGAAREASPPSLPLGLVLEACPDLRDYGPGGRIGSWPELQSAAALVRPMIGISPDAFAEALSALGPLEAHVAVAAILQRSIHSSEAETAPGPAPGGSTAMVNGSPAIQSPGGYLRALTEKARAGEFALGPMLMALIGQRLKARRGMAGRSACSKAAGSGAACSKAAGSGAAGSGAAGSGAAGGMGADCSADAP